MTSTPPLNSNKRFASGPLIWRIISAFILMPIVIYAVHVGGLLFVGLVAVSCVAMLFEWTRMVTGTPRTAEFYILSIFAIIAFASDYQIAFCFAFMSALVAGGVAFAKGKAPVWQALAAVYIIAPCIALVWLRLDAPEGRAWCFILFSIVWAADSGAFFLGKFIGGPKISYALSPSKTWAGIGGGILGGVLVAPLVAQFLFSEPNIFIFAGVGAFLGAASVVGDLVESAFKRKFGIKDISGVIPGHGGVLDRLDGMIFATVAMTSALFIYMVA